MTNLKPNTPPVRTAEPAQRPGEQLMSVGPLGWAVLAGIVRSLSPDAGNTPAEPGSQDANPFNTLPSARRQ